MRVLYIIFVMLKTNSLEHLGHGGIRGKEEYMGWVGFNVLASVVKGKAR